VQIDPAGQKFIEIAPIAIVAAPEPMTVLLLGDSLGVLLIVTAINRPRKQGAYAVHGASTYGKSGRALRSRNTLIEGSL